ncbi:MAG: hypothetical protein WCA39_00885 [Nitrososphaeraceae archaeon]
MTHPAFRQFAAISHLGPDALTMDEILATRSTVLLEDRLIHALGLMKTPNAATNRDVKVIDKDVAALKDLIQIVYAVMDKLIEVYDNLAEENNARGTAIDENDKHDQPHDSNTTIRQLIYG